MLPLFKLKIFVMKICVLIPTHAHTFNKKHANRRHSNNYYGLNIITDVIESAGYSKIDFVDFSQVHEYDVVLFSLLSVEDYYSLVYTYVKKLKNQRSNVWICGGAGISNIYPLLPYFDHIVIGRGENLILPILAGITLNKPFIHQSVVVSSTHREGQIYHINYSKDLWTGSQNTSPEVMSGCKYNCMYCRYRTSSLPPKMRETSKETTMPGNEETFWELEIKNGSFYTTSLDGLTEWARKVVNKNIPNSDIIQKIVDASKQTKCINLKIYFIVGYPHFSSVDFSELLEVFKAIDANVNDCQIFFKLHFTPFSAEPHTPLQWESINLNIDYRQIFDKYLEDNKYLFEGKNLRVMILRTTNKPFTLLKRMVFNRASNDDHEILQFIGSATPMITHSKKADEKLQILQSKFDVSKFIKEYDAGSYLPSDNITVWKPRETMVKECLIYRKRISKAHNSIASFHSPALS